ncbi:MAG: Lactaldehyde dehydrogenase [Candidatus Methanofastidiosum methylothiophilum]|uniref:Lactaldehyde dehydrogenase n=1 Tax=Candidatus Methanofastidiosum methylothiophilum TaxID=1705564 RepID=A0A150J4T5_9EURY|nr:MAG: Lactaldehyde dehydrogenase [Candidatus Methanofastidiosum methylthiophilus]NMC76571.1 aldehyde dehydrogenase family protein [Candidatus Methanofastidiosa archaeon]
MKKILIGGKWVDTNTYLDVINPYTGDLIEKVSKASPENLKEAVESAVKGSKIMRNLTRYRRYEILSKAAEIMLERKDELARTITLESGKPLAFSKGEVSRAYETIVLSAEEAKRLGGEVIPFDAAPTSSDKYCFYIRVPVGIVLAITPFNFPLNLVCHKLGPAIAAGNSVIHKPASKTPLTALILGEILLEAGLPKEALNIVICSAEDAENHLVKNPLIRKISFTGSKIIGERIALNAGLKKLSMELGSNSGVIIDETADINKAVAAVRVGAFGYSGQVCIHCQRAYVHESLYDEFKNKIVDIAKKLVLGDPLHPETDIGPMIDEREIIRVKSWLDEAEKQGAKILCGGEREGFIFKPTIIENVTEEMRIVKDETFGPTLALIKFKDFNDAVNKLNNSSYGLQAGVFTENLRNAYHAIETLDVGGIMINDVPTFRIDLMPYGGLKDSGFGREGPRYAVEEMTEIKCVRFHL